jgi:hypothetical protein
VIFHQEIHDPIDAAAHQLREAQKKQVGELTRIATGGKTPSFYGENPKLIICNKSFHGDTVVVYIHIGVISWSFSNSFEKNPSDPMV